MRNKDLQEIIHLLQKGEERGEELFWYKLILPYKKKCIGYLVYKFKNWELLESPEDIAEDVFLKLREKLILGSKLGLLPNIQGYLNMMCRNEYLERFRRLKPDSILKEHDVPDVIFSPPDFQQKKKEAYEKGFEELPVDKQQLIIWRYLEGRSIEWIANQLGIKYETAKKRGQRTFKVLKELAKGFLGGDLTA